MLCKILKVKCSLNVVSATQFAKQARMEHILHICSVCKSDFAVSSNGVGVCATQVSRKRHKDLAAEATARRCMTTFFSKPSLSDIEHYNSSAELMFSRFILWHNLPMAVKIMQQNCLPKCFPADSDIAGEVQEWSYKHLVTM